MPLPCLFIHKRCAACLISFCKMDYSQLSDSQFFEELNLTFLGLATDSQQSYSFYKGARKKILLRCHPDKGGDQETAKKVNAIWEEYHNRYGNPSHSDASEPPTPQTPEFNISWETELAVLFINALPGTQASCFVVLAPYPDLKPLQREVEKLKMQDLFLGKLESGAGILGFMLTYRMTYSTMCKKVDKNCRRGSKLACCTPKRFTDVKRTALPLFPDGFTTGHLDPAEETENLFDHILLREFAQDNQVTDPVLLHGLYLYELSTPIQDCNLCKEDDGLPEKYQNHRPHHIKHHSNAALFKGVREQKKACQHACDTVLASMRLKMKRETPTEHFVNRLYELVDKLARGHRVKSHAAMGVLWGHMCPGSFVTFAETVYDAIVRCQPKRRGLVFQGPYDCGKTTVAQAIRNFFGGCSLNVNAAKDRLPFELGGALDQRLVIFDDVLGSATGNLNGGWGFKNLDQLRDHLDGAVPVGLERKHQQRVEQIFPPWIITCNEYTIPPSILARCRVLKFQKNLADPDGFMQRNNVTRQDMVTAEAFVMALCIYLPTDFFPDKCQAWVQIIKDDVEPHLEKLELELYDLGCHEEMPPTSPVPPTETRTPEEAVNDFIHFLSNLGGVRPGSGGSTAPDSSAEGPAAKRARRD